MNNIPAFESVPAMLARAAEAHPGREAIREPLPDGTWRTITYADLFRDVEAMASAMLAWNRSPVVGVVGRKAGTTQSLLGPSENLKKYGVPWSAETLDEFLPNPSAKVPGTAMIGILTDPQQRADVIAYLATLKDWPGR